MQEVNMEKHWSAACALIITLGVFVLAAEADGNLTGTFDSTQMCPVYNLIDSPSGTKVHVCLFFVPH